MWFLPDTSLQPANLIESFYSFNARSLVTNLADFHLFVLLKMPAVAAVTETWLNDLYTDTFVCPPGYTVFRKDRLSRGGDVAIFVRKDIHAELELIDCLYNNLEVICVDLTFVSQKIRVFTCYRPPYYANEDVQYVENSILVLSRLCIGAQKNIVGYLETSSSISLGLTGLTISRPLNNATINL